VPVSSVRDLVDIDNVPFDPELQTIIDLLTPRLGGVEQSAEPITFVTYQMYTIVRDLIENEIRSLDDVWDWVTEVAIVGGVMINRRSGGDFFQPLTFQLRTQEAPPEDLYEQAFGPRPDLLPILGSQAPTQRVLERASERETREVPLEVARTELSRSKAGPTARMLRK